MDNSELEKRITVLEDIEAIKKLKALYCEICDDDHNQDRIVTIFTEDGIWESQDLGQAHGHAELRKLFKNFAERISFSQHNVMNPIIEVDGDTAKGSWYFHGTLYLSPRESRALAGGSLPGRLRQGQRPVEVQASARDRPHGRTL
jgi:hypothetical protein